MKVNIVVLKELRGLFQEQTESLKNIAKSYIFMDLKEDSVYIRKVINLHFQCFRFGKYF